MLTRRAFLAAGALTPSSLAHAAPKASLRDLKDEKVSFFDGQRLLFEYRYAALSPKTYVHPFCAPDGTPLTLDSPEDHVHHRGLMLAWSSVNKIDFWGETNLTPHGHGQIVHRGFEQKRGKPPLTITAGEYWVSEGKVYIIERRTIRALVLTPDAVWLDWTSELIASGATVTLSAEEHVYNGLGIRFVHSMDLGGVLNAKGTAEIEKANGEGAAWCAYFGKLDKGGIAGVVIFDDPANPRHPTPFFVMNKPFGYLSAAPTFRKPLELHPGSPLRLRYAVVSFLGEPTAGRLEGMYRSWLSQNKG